MAPTSCDNPNSQSCYYNGKKSLSMIIPVLPVDSPLHTGFYFVCFIYQFMKLWKVTYDTCALNHFSARLLCLPELFHLLIHLGFFLTIKSYVSQIAKKNIKTPSRSKNEDTENHKEVYLLWGQRGRPLTPQFLFSAATWWLLTYMTSCPNLKTAGLEI